MQDFKLTPPRVDDSGLKPSTKKKLWHYKKTLNTKICCRTCRHCVKIIHNGKTYYKCTLLGISNSEATDIRLSYVCDRWEKRRG